MKRYKYTLEPYKGLNSRFECPYCGKANQFTRYINTITGEYLDPSVGKCNRDNKCGYHKTPGQFFKENPGANQNLQPSKAFRKPEEKKPQIFSTHPLEIMQQSRKKYDQNNLFIYLEKLCGHEKALSLMEKYRIGTSSHWPGATIFWQIDQEGRVRAGKIMLLNKESGKRIKKPFPLLTWVHSVLKIEDFKLKQCFFGEHLLNENPGKVVAIAESEKTAMICSVVYPKMVWLAAGNLNGLTLEKCRILQGKRVVLFPDLKCFEIWKTKIRDISGKMNIGNLVVTTFKVSDLLEKNAGGEDKEQGYDLADYLTLSDRPLNGTDSVLLPSGHSIETLSRDGVTWTVEINEHGYPASWDN